MHAFKKTACVSQDILNVTKDTYMPGKDICILDVIIEMYTYIILEQYCSRVGLSKTKKTKQKQKTHNKTKHWHHSFDC